MPREWVQPCPAAAARKRRQAREAAAVDRIQCDSELLDLALQITAMPPAAASALIARTARALSSFGEGSPAAQRHPRMDRVTTTRKKADIMLRTVFMAQACWCAAEWVTADFWCSEQLQRMCCSSSGEGKRW